MKRDIVAHHPQTGFRVGYSRTALAVAGVVGTLAAGTAAVGRVVLGRLTVKRRTGPRSLDVLKGHKYANLTTFRRSGEAVTTPVWFVLVGDRAYVETDPASGKAKRIRDDPRVVLAPSMPWGTQRGGEGTEGVARIIDGDAPEGAEAALRKKYRLEEAVARPFGALGEFEGRPTLEIRPADTNTNQGG